MANRPGAATNIGTEAAVRAPPDGYTLVQLGPPAAINATLYGKLNFNVIRDIAPVASIARAPNVMEVSLSVPVKTVPEFIAYAKANPVAGLPLPGGSRTLWIALKGFRSIFIPLSWTSPGATAMNSRRLIIRLPRRRWPAAFPGW
jgi:tripartite-type tricarboxylate transporter receptor subunit TctC